MKDQTGSGSLWPFKSRQAQNVTNLLSYAWVAAGYPSVSRTLLIYQAAKVAQIHPDKESIELLMQSFSLISQSPELPQRDGHQPFELTPEEIKEEATPDNFDFATGEIPRPKWT